MSRHRGYRELGIDAAEIVIEAKAKIGEFTKAMAKARTKGAGRGLGSVPSGNKPKGAQLEAEHLSRKEAAECEAIHAIRAPTGRRTRTPRGGQGRHRPSPAPWHWRSCRLGLVACDVSLVLSRPRDER